MTHLSGSVHGEAWFVVLPDRAAALAVSHAPALTDARRLDRGPGRPWLLGQWRDEHVTVAEAGPLRVALIGYCSMSEAELAAAIRPLRGVREVDRLLPRLSGSFHLVAADADGVRVQGTVSGSRRVFRTRAGHHDLAASRADVLAQVRGTGIDDRQVAARLLSPAAPHPLQGQSVWSGVRSVPEDAYVYLRSDRPAAVTAWWRPPAAELPLPEGALLLRDALGAAVAAAVRGGGARSCDLSGGLDSTSVCFLAAGLVDRLTTFSFPAAGTGDDDPYWVKTALAAMPEADAVFLPGTAAPLPFEGVSEPGTVLDEPYLGLEDSALLLSAARRLPGRCSSRLHLTGHGGDEVVECMLSYLHDLARDRPQLAWAHLRGYRARHRWPLRGSLSALADRRTYRQWLDAAFSGLTRPVPPATPADHLGWGQYPRLPQWATARAAEAVRSLAGETPWEPLAERPGQHETWEAVRHSGRAVRLDRWLTADSGLPMAAPFLDDRVVEACLAVRPHERTTPWHYKPLLTEAMRGTVPDELLRRTTKGGGVAEELEYEGLRRHRDGLLALTEDSRLAARGLIDAAALRRVCAGSFLPGLSPHALAATLACEAWLRDVESTAGRRDLPEEGV
ncbi:asparagine synthase [Streptomyces sp. Ru73]|uniref:asparagine synthase-related protein n=1 Tax=Streptomyces sp. Ru73 TaxID=2080748 RepID=UPI000CDE2885|nr:asparagine synthase-related protein [Streptomyces sp. Ru73]POX37198.1 asparagine synthase [Streptomyces sp. Ru73]